MEVAGVDGCPGGWVVAYVRTGQPHQLLSAFVVPDFAEVARRTKDCAAVGIDIPIGLSDNGRRRADVEARRLLSPLRHNSVFPSPIRPVLSANTYQEANAISSRFHVDGKKISKQTWFLTIRIATVDRHMTPDLQARIREVHPEVCFWAMNGELPLEDAKRMPAGERQRRHLLDSTFTGDVATIDVPPRANRDDLYDAMAAAWTASRIATGEACTLPEDHELDSRGLRMEIVF